MDDNKTIICRLCLSIVESEFVSHSIAPEMIEFCLPEINLNSTKNPVICETCNSLLKQLFAFKSMCMETEDRITNFKEINGTGIVDLLSLTRIENTKPKIKSEIDIEPECITAVKEENEIQTRDEPTINVKVEEESNDEFQFVNCGFAAVKQELIDDAEDETTSNVENENLPWYTCDICSYRTKWRHHVKRHKQIHEVSVESKLAKKFKCLKCGFISNYKHDIHKHSVLEHGNWFKCDQCDYQTKWKRLYNQHLLTHQGGQLWHECELCSYKTKWKYHLKRHMSTHQ